jgi:serine/threonine protein kinase
MHKKGIVHRDIRPHNIFYSSLKKSFIIGGMENAILVDNNRINPQIGFNLSGVPYYLPRYLVKIGKKEDFS